MFLNFATSVLDTAKPKTSITDILRKKQCFVFAVSAAFWWAGTSPISIPWGHRKQSTWTVYINWLGCTEQSRVRSSRQNYLVYTL